MNWRRGGAVLAPAVVLVACATTTDYQKEAADFIESETVANQLKVTFTGATCGKPDAVKVGTEYACTATGSDGVNYRFVVRISGDKEFTLNPPEPVG